MKNATTLGISFVPEAKVSVQESPQTSAAPIDDRRKYPRYRFMTSIQIRKASGPEQLGMTIEISEGGASIATAETLEVGETVELDSVLGEKASAVIRHKQGRIYGLEFVKLSLEHRERIRVTCKRLPPFYARSLNI